MSGPDRLTRRDVLVGAGGALALAFAPYSVARQVRVPGVVVFSESSEASRRFAAVLATSGATPVALTGDLVRQWYMGLREEVAHKGGALAGFTSWSDYLVARGLAAEHRRHPRFEAKHRCGPDGSEHCVPARCGFRAGRLEGEDWPEAMARLVLEVGSDQPVEANATRVVRAARGGSAAETHFSWLLG